MLTIRQACVLYDLEMAIHRGNMDPCTMMQAELNELTPEQNGILIQQLQKNYGVTADTPTQEPHAEQH